MSNLIIIPTYNEIENIENIIRKVFSLEESFSILIIDDGSPDGTAKKVKELQKEFSKTLFIEERKGKLGLGTAYILGFKWALKKDYQYIFEMDADFSHKFDDLIKIIEVSSDFGLVIGSRYIDEGGSNGWDFKRKILSSFANKLSKFALKTNINDMTSGFRCYSVNALTEIKYDTTKSDGYAFQVEMSVRCEEKGISIKEVPIIFNERRLGKSKMSKKIIFEAFSFLLKNGFKRWLNIKIA